MVMDRLGLGLRQIWGLIRSLKFSVRPTRSLPPDLNCWSDPFMMFYGSTRPELLYNQLFF
jgi:hypothetical protein